MAKAAATPKKPPAKAAKRDINAELHEGFDALDQRRAAKKPATTRNWRVEATTADEVAAKIDQALQGKLANVAGAKAKKKAAIHKDSETPTQKAAKGTPKRGAKTAIVTSKAKTAAKAPTKPRQKRAAQPPGRPSLFTQAIADAICERIGKGEPLEQICRDDNMPAVRTVNGWKNTNDTFSAAIACAREEGHDAIAAQCMEIADFGLNDTYVDDNGYTKTDTDVIQRSKLRIETRLKLLAKWNPSRYGDKVDVNHGVQPDNPLAALLAQVSGTALPIIKGNGDE